MFRYITSHYNYCSNTTLHYITLVLHQDLFYSTVVTMLHCITLRYTECFTTSQYRTLHYVTLSVSPHHSSAPHYTTLGVWPHHSTVHHTTLYGVFDHITVQCTTLRYTECLTTSQCSSPHYTVPILHYTSVCLQTLVFHYAILTVLHYAAQLCYITSLYTTHCAAPVLHCIGVWQRYTPLVFHCTM